MNYRIKKKLSFTTGSPRNLEADSVLSEEKFKALGFSDERIAELVKTGSVEKCEMPGDKKPRKEKEIGPDSDGKAGRTGNIE